MALTKISTGGVKDDAVTAGKIPANAIGSSEIASNAVTVAELAVDAVEDDRIKTSNSVAAGKFLQYKDHSDKLTWADANQYTHPDHSGEVTSSADGATVIASNIVDEDNLKISNAGTNGQYLQKQSGNTGGLTWADVTIPPAGNTFTAVANGAIANNKAVKLDTDGKVSEIAESVTNLSVPTKIGGGSDTAIVQFTLSNKYAQWMRIARISDAQYACLWFSPIDDKIRARIFTVNGESFTVHSPLTDGPQMQELSSDGDARDLDIIYDPNRGKLLAVWTNGNHHCIGKVGTVSGTGTSASITWDTNATTIRSGSSSNKTRGNCLVWNEDLNNIGYFYFTDASPDKYYGKIVTINSSGGIELGTELDLTFSNDDFPIGTVYSLDATYDTNGNRFGVWVTAIDSNSNSRYRGMGVCLSASGSGTSAALTKTSGHQSDIAYWQLETSYNHGKYMHLKCCYIPENDIVAVVYVDSGDSNKVKMRFFENHNSNNDFSFGSETTLIDSAGSWSIVYSPGINKPVVFYVGSDGKIYSFLLTISGNTKTATYTKSSVTTLYAGSTDWYRVSAAGWNSPSTLWQRAVASASGGQLFFPCIHGSNTGNRTSYMLSAKVQSVTPNFTVADSYVGYADQAYTNGQTVTVKTYGNNVSTLSGLTIGSKYYVQTDGTVGTTAASTNAVAGIAIAADKLLIREPT